MAYNAAIHLDWGLFFVLEIEAAPLRALLPPGLKLQEPAPGSALVTVNLVHFVAGGDRVDLPENDEIDFGIGVVPDNAGYIGLPQAGAAVHVLNIASSSEPYLGVCRESGYPTHAGEGMVVERSPDGHSGAVRDRSGPIVNFAATPGEHRFEPVSRIGQDAIHDHRGEFRLNYVLEGEGLVDARPDSFALTVHDHPFFRGVDLSGARQHAPAALRPGARATLSFYGPNES